MQRARPRSTNQSPLARPAERAEADGRPIAAYGVILVALGLTALLALLNLLGLSASPLTWYLARASGFSLYLLFWLSVVSGLGLTTSLLDGFGGRAAIWFTHRFITELAFVFLALHMVSLAADPAVELGLAGVLLPFVSDVRQPWTDLGILSAAGMAVLAVSFSLRRFIGRIGWRLLHYGAFPLWITGLAHGVGSGSDSSRPWAAFIYVTTTGAVLFLSLYRLLTSRIRRPVHEPRLNGDAGQRSRAEPRAEAEREVPERCASSSSKMKRDWRR